MNPNGYPQNHQYLQYYQNPNGNINMYQNVYYPHHPAYIHQQQCHINHPNGGNLNHNKSNGNKKSKRKQKRSKKKEKLEQSMSVKEALRETNIWVQIADVWKSVKSRQIQCKSPKTESSKYEFLKRHIL